MIPNPKAGVLTVHYEGNDFSFTTTLGSAVLGGLGMNLANPVIIEQIVAQLKGMSAQLQTNGGTKVPCPNCPGGVMAPTPMPTLTHSDSTLVPPEPVSAIG